METWKPICPTCNVPMTVYVEDHGITQSGWSGEIVRENADLIHHAICPQCDALRGPEDDGLPR